MSSRTSAVSILQRARDVLSRRLSERVIEARDEIEVDAEGGSYLSEIEAIYDQLGARLAHVNAMLASLPPEAGPAPADATASEIIYADLASAYPTGLELESSAPAPLLGLPAPAEFVLPTPTDIFHTMTLQVQTGDVSGASRTIAELFDIKPSDARRCAATYAQKIASNPELVYQVNEFSSILQQTNEYSAAAILSECFGFCTADALAIVRRLKANTDGQTAD